MGTLDVHFSSKKEDWETPYDFYQELNNEFHFTYDGAASAHNSKCANYASDRGDGVISWIFEPGASVWCNPPYGRGTARWLSVARCSTEGEKAARVVVVLLPARTDTRWFHEYAPYADEIRFIKGRLVFEENGQPATCKNPKSKNFGKVTPAPFPSMLMIFRRKNG